jgi:hypothetical protein
MSGGVAIKVAATLCGAQGEEALKASRMLSPPPSRRPSKAGVVPGGGWPLPVAGWWYRRVLEAASPTSLRVIEATGARYRGQGRRGLLLVSRSPSMPARRRGHVDKVQPRQEACMRAPVATGEYTTVPQGGRDRRRHSDSVIIRRTRLPLPPPVHHRGCHREYKPGRGGGSRCRKCMTTSVCLP